MWNWMTQAFETEDESIWSRYATDLYVRIHDKAVADGWSEKLRYLLYEYRVTAQDAPRFQRMDGVLLQSASETEKSRNPYIAALQK